MLSEYEQVRLDNIARNDQFLQEIGLNVKSSGVGGKRPKSSSSSAPRAKRHMPPEDDNNNPFLRRSSRVAALPVVHTMLEYDEDGDGNGDREREVKQGIRYGYKLTHKRGKSVAGEGEGDGGERSSGVGDGIDSAPQQQQDMVQLKPHATASRELDAQYGRFTGVGAGADLALGSSYNLGNVVPALPFGKAAVMGYSSPNTAFSSLSSTSIGSTSPLPAPPTSTDGAWSVPKFSKYSGVVEWKNCVYLWVNLGSSNPGEYINVFTERGRYMTWYGGSKMHEDSPVTKRLMKAPKSTGASGKETVLLFVRLEKEPYTCLGTVAISKSNIAVHPVEFTWELLAYEKLKDRSNFQRILRNA